MSVFSDRFPASQSFVDYVEQTFDIHPVQWTTGGMTGGNCWGGSADCAVEADEEPEFEVLDDILLDVYPTLTFLQYRILMRAQIMTITSHNDHEYYGNYTTYKKKSLDLDALYRALAKLQ